MAAVGHDLVFGSRHPDQHTALDYPVVSSAEAIAGSDVVVNALDGKSALDALTAMKDDLVGHLLLDVGNAVDENFDPIYSTGSLGERLQQALPGTQVVKSLSTMWGQVAFHPDQLPAPTSVFLSGDDREAKSVIASLLVDLGWSREDQIDLGDIATAKAAEHYFVLFTQLRQNYGDAAFNIAVVR